MVNILVTGVPRVGKTTLITSVVDELGFDAVGFITKEVCVGGRRVGFEIKTFSGKTRMLAFKNYRSKYRVGSYGVYLENIDSTVQDLEEEMRGKRFQLIVIDEIGKMELFSERFRNFVVKCLDQGKVLGTIMLRDNSFTREIKRREDTKVFYLTENNRNEVKSSIIEILRTVRRESWEC
ncbi:MAG: nucleoside-triphosphatase [Candidatus Odinarchaeia archaeon]